MFDISVPRISHIIHITWIRILEHVRWPTLREWRQLRDNWHNLHDAVGCIDGTHEIQIPSTEPHNLYYSGHHRYHCIHTQVIIDNQLNIRHVESGFLGHNNDAQTFRMMTNIGDGEILDLPRNCVLLGDCIYPSRHSLVTPYTSAHV
jgi:hypothetical protein